MHVNISCSIVFDLRSCILACTGWGPRWHLINVCGLPKIVAFSSTLSQDATAFWGPMSGNYRPQEPSGIVGCKGKRCHTPWRSVDRALILCHWTRRWIYHSLLTHGHGYLPNCRAVPLLLGLYSFLILLREGGWVGLSGWLHTKTVYP